MAACSPCARPQRCSRGRSVEELTILLAEADGLDLMRKLGNSGGGLPYTVVADRQGAIVHRKLGALKRAELEAVLAPLARHGA